MKDFPRNFCRFTMGKEVENIDEEVSRLHHPFLDMYASHDNNELESII